MTELPKNDTAEFRAIMLQKISGLIQIQVQTHQAIMESIGNLTDHQQVAMTVSCPTMYESEVQAIGYDVFIDHESNAVAFFGIVEGSQDYVLSVYPVVDANTFTQYTYITREPTTITVQTVEGDYLLFANMDEVSLENDAEELEGILDILNRTNTILESNIAERLKNLPNTE